MEKTEFLCQLKKALNKGFSRKDIKEIINDYSEYFDTGMSEGKSEQDLCVEFGEPTFIASELIHERGEKEKKGLILISSKALLIKIFFALLFFASLFLAWLLSYADRYGYQSILKIYLDLALTLLLPLSMLGFINIAKILQNTKEIKLHNHIYLLSIIPIVLSIIYVSLFTLPVLLQSDLSVQIMGPLITMGIIFIYSILISVAYLSTLISIAKKSFAVSFIYFYTGLFVMILNIQNLLKDLSAPLHFKEDLIRCLYPIPFSVLLLIISFLLMKKLYQPLKVGE